MNDTLHPLQHDDMLDLREADIQVGDNFNGTPVTESGKGISGGEIFKSTTKKTTVGEIDADTAALTAKIDSGVADATFILKEAEGVSEQRGMDLHDFNFGSGSPEANFAPEKNEAIERAQANLAVEAGLLARSAFHETVEPLQLI